MGMEDHTHTHTHGDPNTHGRHGGSSPSCCQRTSLLGNECVPIQLAQCRFPGLATGNAKILIYFSYNIYGSSFIEQHWETVTV